LTESRRYETGGVRGIKQLDHPTEAKRGVGLSLELPIDDRYVGLVRHVAAQAARRAALGEERIDDVKVAVTEVVSYAMAAHRRADLESPVLVEMEIGGAFRLRVSDRAGGLTLDEVDSPASFTDDSRLGLAITKALVDDLLIEPRDGGGSIVTMVVTQE
jgi:anti-sigma regulatory factor (Ser/Thr protein kinase)